MSRPKPEGNSSLCQNITEPHYVNLLILVARLTQVACGLLILGFSVAATVRNEEYWYGYDHDLPFASIFCGAGIAIFGACGLFGVRRRGDEPDQIRLSTLLLFIDCCVLILCLAIGTVSLGTSAMRCDRVEMLTTMHRCSSSKVTIGTKSTSHQAQSYTPLLFLLTCAARSYFFHS